MQVHNIQSNNYANYNSLNFGALNISKPAQKLINSWHDNAEILQKIGIWKKELAETKNYDLNLHETFNELWMTIESKNPYFPGDCIAPLRVLVTPNGNKLWVYGIDVYDKNDEVGYPLKFATSEDAENAYAVLKRYQESKDTGEINKINWAVDSVKILEQGSEYLTRPDKTKKPSMPETKEIKISFWQRFKNALTALKG